MNNRAGGGGLSGPPCAGGSGGGLFIAGGTPVVLADCIVEGNASGAGGISLFALGPAGDGGGIFVSGATLRLENCEFRSNAAAPSSGSSVGGRCGNGGAIYSPSAQLTVTGCRFIENHAGDGMGNTNNCVPGGEGGAIYHIGTLTVDRSQFLANRAGHASGSCPNAFRGGHGGALYLQSVANPGLNARIMNSLFAANRSGNGSNSWNSSSGGSGGSGGAIFRTGSNLTVVNCTITQNAIGASGMGEHVPGIPGLGGAISSSNEFILANSIAYGNDDPELNGVVTARYSDVEGGLAGIGNIDADPQFANPDGPDNDPDTWQDNDYQLCATSPCIDAGDNSAIQPGVTLDLAEEPRRVDDCATFDTGVGPAPIVDIGAYEFLSSALPPGDLDGDHDVDVADLAQLLSHFGLTDATYSDGDIDADGDVDLGDLSLLLSHFGNPCG